MAGTINRFNRFMPRDYSMKWYMPEVYVPDFQQWDSLLAGQQQKYNAAMAATQKYPKHLEWRKDLAGEYKQNIETKLDDITTSFINEGVRTGNRKLRDFAFELNQQWNPGGLAHELEKEFEDYQSGIKQITDYYEKNKAENSANRTYSLFKLKEAAQGEFKRDPNTGLYSRAGIVPELVPYVDIAEEALKVVKEIKDSGTTSIVSRGPAWFEKIQREGVTEETIREVTDALLEQPKYSQQLSVEKWLIDKNIPQDKKDAIVNEAKDRLANTVVKVQEDVNKLAKSKDEKDRKSLQKQLKEAGYYEGTIDGKIGKQSQEAIDKYLKDLTDKTNKKSDAINYDNLIETEIRDSYARPLIKAFAREKINRDLIFNRQWEVNARIASQRKASADLVAAIQSLKNPEKSEYIATPGMARPMETIEKLKQDHQKAYNESKKAFDQVAQWSGITDIIGYRAPNKIHEVTQAKIGSKTYKDFVTKMQGMGYGEEIASNAWNFYNSPAAGELYTSYTHMNTAKQAIDGINNTKTSMALDYSKTPEGKKEIEKLRKTSNFKGTDQELIEKLVTGTGVTMEARPITIYSDKEFGLPIQSESNVTIGGNFINKMNDYYQNKPEAIPESLRGYRFKALKGAGADMENVVKKDFKEGYTLGYTSLDGGEPYYSHIGKNNKIDPSEVEMTGLSFDVTPAGVIYYATGKDANGKPVSAIMNAPRSHFPNLANVAIDMKKEAKDGDNEFLDNLSNSLYAVTTEGPQYQQAVDDALILNEKNTAPLKNVIDPRRSENGKVETFGNNANIRGTAVGAPIIVDGLSYQKFKVYNPKTEDTSFMLTLETKNGLYLPVANKKGGLYYKSSTDAEAPIWDRRLMNKVPVEINQQTFKPTTLSEEDLKIITIGAQSQLDSENDEE